MKFGSVGDSTFSRVEVKLKNDMTEHGARNTFVPTSNDSTDYVLVATTCKLLIVTLFCQQHRFYVFNVFAPV